MTYKLFINNAFYYPYYLTALVYNIILHTIILYIPVIMWKQSKLMTAQSKKEQLKLKQQHKSVNMNATKN